MKTSMMKVLDLSELYTKIKSQTLPISTTYKLTKLFNAITSEKSFYETQLQSIIEKFGKRDESGQLMLTEAKDGVQISQENIAETQKAIDELCSIEVDLPNITFSLSELEKVTLSVEEFNILMPFISED